MHYTVAIIEDIQGNVKVNFDKTGNKFVVGLYNKKTKEYTPKHLMTKWRIFNI